VVRENVLVARLAAELRELEQLVVRSRECLVDERGLNEMATGIAREAQVADTVRSAARRNRPPRGAKPLKKDSM